MNVAWYRFRTSFRRRWAGYLGVVLLIGLIGGVALGSIAGARRTASAFHRFLARSNPSDMAIDAGPYDQKLVDKFLHFPEVVGGQSYVAFDVSPLNPDGSAHLDDATLQIEWVSSLDGLYFDVDRFAVTEGRAADPKDPTQIMVSESAAKVSGYRVGQRIPVGVFDDADVGQASGDHPPVAKQRFTLEVVGIGLFNDEVIQDEADRVPRIVTTPAFTAKAKRWATYAWTGIRLRNGAADVATVKTRYLKVLPPEYPHFFRVTEVTQAQAQRAIRPQAVALGVFGVLALLTALVLAGQAVGRQLQLERGDLEQLRAMGAAPRATSVQGLFAVALVVLAGALLAAVVAIVLSPLAPIGHVRRVEVDPGAFFDWTVLAAGAATIVVVHGTAATLMARRQAPHRVARRRVRRPRPSSAVQTATVAHLPLTAVTGIRQAVLPGSSRSSVPARSVLTGAVVAIVAMVASLTFAASLDHLVTHPSLFGWDWDEMLLASGGYGNVPATKAEKELGADPDIEATTGIWFGSLELDGQNVPVVGVQPGAAVHPPVLSGHPVETDDQVVLGATTLDQLHKSVGDSVVLAGDKGSVRLKIVGTATLPTVGVLHGSHTSMGSGALLAYTLIPGFARNITQSEEEGPNAILVRFRAGADRAKAQAGLRRHVGKLTTLYTDVGPTGVQRPAEIVNSQDMGSGPAVLAGALLLSALLSLVLALFGTVRRRRRDLALLKALGFTRRQLQSTVMWQAAVTVGLGVLIGVPVGIVVGRTTWSVFARQLHVVDRPAVPLLAIAAVTAGALVVSILAAAVPGRSASRVPTGELLRTE